MSLPRSTPEAAGLPSAAISAFIDAAAGLDLDLHSLMVLRHGQVIAEGWWAPYGPNDVHLLYSLSKSFTATAVGLAVSAGLLTVDDQVISFFPEDVPEEVEPNLALMKVRHLLSMSTGQEADNLIEFYREPTGNWVRAFLERTVPYEPGTKFMYNSGATYMLSAIVQKLTGETVLEYLRPRLLDPLGIEQATWETDPKGICVGGWGMSVTTEAIANFGQLYLQKGVWEGKQVVPCAWVEEASRFHISNGDDPTSEWSQGYGYQFWRCRHNAYRGDGAFGQYCVIMPDQDMVVAITSSVHDMGAVLNLIWDQLLASAQPGPLPEDAAGHEALVSKLASLDAKSPSGSISSELADDVSGSVYRNSRGDTVRLEFLDSLVEFVDSRRLAMLKIGLGSWFEDQMDLEGFGPQRMASRGAWVDGHTFAAEFRAIESPYAVGMTAVFEGDSIFTQFTPRGRFGALDVREFRGARV